MVGVDWERKMMAKEEDAYLWLGIEFRWLQFLC